MTSLTAVLRGRRLAERRMSDTWVIQEVNAASPVDPVTGVGTMVTIYTGKARLMTYEPFEQVADAVGSEITTQRYSLHLPVSAPSPHKNAVATCTASTGDPALVGRKVRVLAQMRKTEATAQRIPVEEVL